MGHSISSGESFLIFIIRGLTKPLFLFRSFFFLFLFCVCAFLLDMLISPIKTERLYIFHHCIVAFKLTVNIYKSPLPSTWKGKRKLKELKTVNSILTCSLLF